MGSGGRRLEKKSLEKEGGWKGEKLIGYAPCQHWNTWLQLHSQSTCWQLLEQFIDFGTVSLCEMWYDPILVK